MDSACAFEAAGFEGKVGQTIALPSANGPMTVLVGVGEAEELDADKCGMPEPPSPGPLETAQLDPQAGRDGLVAPDVAGQMLVEGALLARYRYDVLKAKPTVEPIKDLAMVVEGRRSAASTGATRGVITAEATNIARDLANTPPALLTALDMAKLATSLGKKRGLDARSSTRRH